MSAEQTTSLVQRKARTGSEAYAARAMSMGRALRLTAAKQADHLMGLALSALSVTRRPLGAEEVADALDPARLILLMDGPGHQVAAVMLEPALVTGLIQQQTMGKVKPVMEGGETRRFTATDAALCAPFVEALLAGAAKLPEEERDRGLLQGYRFGVWAQETRHAQLVLDGAEYELIEMTLDLAAGARAGGLSLILPLPAQARPEPEEDEEAETPQAPRRGATLTQNVLALPTVLSVALTRFKLPLQQVTGLRIGDVLPLHVSSMAQALVLDANGRAVSRCTVGQLDGARAVQVEQKKRPVHHDQPRRRASDRDELDLPDVTADPPDRRASAAQVADPGAVPRMGDVDIFGTLEDVSELPDIDTAEQAADDQMESWNDGAKAEAGQTSKQAGW